jgi:hypothetical protein
MYSMGHNLDGFNLNQVRLDLFENGLDRLRPDCQIDSFKSIFKPKVRAKGGHVN